MQPSHPLARFMKSFTAFINNDRTIKSRPLKAITGKFNRSLEEIHIKRDSSGNVTGYLIHRQQKVNIEIKDSNVVIGGAFPTVFPIEDKSGIAHYLERLYNMH
ncbi:hypothetical protein CF8_0037 [Aeromonas phage CF8]|nr:hypothetical protein CF8_0037 [Aeromonas phage CF8]